MNNTNNYFFLIFCFTIHSATAQEIDKNKNYTPVAIGFWNIENLYDTINDPLKNDEEFLPDGKNKWNGEKYKTKIERLSDVISQLATESTPDGVAVLGLCEIENETVLNDLSKSDKLVSRNYKIAHIEGPDKRGVDVALLYNPKYFQLTSIKAFTVILATDSTHPTRDELLVSGKLLGENFHFIVCHWPSRRGGETRSQPNRIAAGKKARTIIDSLLAADANAKVILMGDLNDDPTDKSIKQSLNTEKDANKVQDKQLFNAMENLFKKGIGTLAYNDAWNLFDQQIMTSALAKNDYKDLQFYTSHIFNKNFILEDKGRYKGYPKRTFSGGEYTAGYSDHFAVYSILLKERK